MGVSHYAWSSSPLRRYVDLVNQRQLIACIRSEASPYAAGDADLFAIVSAFDAAYGAYAEFQERMERYWGLRWMRQENVGRMAATVIRGDVLRLAGIPFVTRLPGLPELPRGQQLELDILGGDEIDLTLEARVHRVLDAAAAEEAAAADDEVETEAAPGPLPGAAPASVAERSDDGSIA
jgi:exoribonuclease-2